MIEKEYIDLEETVTTLKRNSQKYFSSFHKGYVQAIEDLADIPAAKVSPVRHEHWILLRESEITGFDPEFAGRNPIGGYQCSNCNKEAILDCNDEFVLSSYCPNCGAKMDGDKYA